MISTNGYLSTSFSKDVAISFSGESTDTETSVLFEIKYDLKNINTVIMAPISEGTGNESEQEVLFDLDAVFEILSVYRDESLNKLIVQMQATDQGSILAQEYIKEHRRQINTTSVILVYGRLLTEIGQYDKSQKYFERLLENPNGEDLSFIYYYLGAIHYHKGYYEKALQYYESSYNILINSTPSAYVLNDIASIFSIKGQYDKALDYNIRALKISENISNYRSISISLSNIGIIYRIKDEYDLALDYHMKCYQIRIQYLPYEQKEIARTLDHIAAVYNDKDDLSNAMIYHEKSFKINEICLPVEHDLIGSNLNNIATILTNQGKYNEAFEYFEKALKNEKQNCIKPNLIRLARNYDNMGICLCDQDNEKIGLEYRMKAVKLIDQVSPRIQHADWIDNVGNEFFKKEFYDCALECYLISLNMKLECLSNDHIDITDSLMVLGDVYLKKNFKIQARFYYEKSLIIYESKEHFNTIDVLNCIGMIYEYICKYYLALEYYKKALAFSEKYYPADNSVKTTNENNIARIKWFIK